MPSTKFEFQLNFQIFKFLNFLVLLNKFCPFTYFPIYFPHSLAIYWSNCLNCFNSHKKWKDSLETLAELAVLRTYDENQAILEPIRLYQASKYKQTKEQGNEDCLWTHIFIFFQIIVSFFFVYVKMQTKPDQTAL